MKTVAILASALFAVAAVAAEPAKKEAAKPVEKDGVLLPAKKQDKAPAKKEEVKKEAKKEDGTEMSDKEKRRAALDKARKYQNKKRKEQED